MSSEIDSKDTTDEEKDCFVGIDPDDTLQVSFGGALFTLGPIPSGIWQRLTATRGLSFQGAVRRTIKRMAENGENPDELEWTKEKDKVDATKGNVAAAADPEHREKLVELQLEAIKFAVRDHTGFKNRHGNVFPCETESVSYSGETLKVLSAKTLRVYRANARLLDKLWIACHKLNELGRLGKKD